MALGPSRGAARSAPSTDPGSPQPTALHSIVVRAPSPPRIATSLVDHIGNPVTVACGACHATRPPNGAAGAPPLRDAAALRDFHQGLVFRHADLACASCHNVDDAYDSLRLADGTRVPYPEVLTLCAQCHGTQFADFRHGTHGGMNGSWDLSRGGRVRNNCIDCHDPHAPKYPTVTPARGPNDRFLERPKHE